MGHLFFWSLFMKFMNQNRLNTKLPWLNNWDSQTSECGWSTKLGGGKKSGVAVLVKKIDKNNGKTEKRDEPWSEENNSSKKRNYSAKIWK